jgi:hypothetical protein
MPTTSMLKLCKRRILSKRFFLHVFSEPFLLCNESGLEMSENVIMKILRLLLEHFDTRMLMSSTQPYQQMWKHSRSVK